MITCSLTPRATFFCLRNGGSCAHSIYDLVPGWTRGVRRGLGRASTFVACSHRVALLCTLASADLLLLADTDKMLFSYTTCPPWALRLLKPLQAAALLPNKHLFYTQRYPPHNTVYTLCTDSWCQCFAIKDVSFWRNRAQINSLNVSYLLQESKCCCFQIVY